MRIDDAVGRCNPSPRWRPPVGHAGCQIGYLQLARAARRRRKPILAIEVGGGSCGAEFGPLRIDDIGPVSSTTAARIRPISDD